MASRNALLLLFLVVLGIVSHVLIHFHATRLAESKRLPTAAKQPQQQQQHGTAASSEACRSGAPLSVLVIHEHHLKPIGSDVRLLGVVAQLRGLGHTVSLLFRGKTSADQRSPPTHELAELLGAARRGEFVLSTTEPPPAVPAIYEYGDLESLAGLARQGWFDAVLCPLWFWRDPMASAAELLLPTLALHAPAGRRPFVGFLSDRTFHGLPPNLPRAFHRPSAALRCPPLTFHARFAGGHPLGRRALGEGHDDG